MRALASSTRSRVVTDNRYVPGRTAAFYGVTIDGERVWKAATASGLDWYYVDHGYFGRGEHYRITKNAEQIDARTTAPDWDRLARHGLFFERWRRSGRHILVCAQSDWWHWRHDRMTADVWAAKVAAEIAQHSGRPVRIRYKPKSAKGTHPADVAKTQASIDADLEDCHALVTHTSNAAIDALQRGVPVFVDRTSAAASMGRTLDDLHQIENPRRPDDRVEWAAVLAANQWTVDEIRGGLAWKAVGG